jgi:hypothetical protein
MNFFNSLQNIISEASSTIQAKIKRKTTGHGVQISQMVWLVLRREF